MLARHSVVAAAAVAAAARPRVATVAAPAAAAAVTAVRRSHGLTVPYTHVAVTPFENGVPSEQVRDLHPVEKKWDFWTTSDAFLAVKPTAGGYTHVPYGEVWVLKSGKVLNEGTHFLLSLSSVKAVKNTHPISFGVVSPAVTTKDGVSVNAYAVVYARVTDPAASALYVDPESNLADSERAAAKIVKKHLEQFVPSLSVGNSSSLATSAVEALKGDISAALKAKADTFGLEVLSVDVRGVFPSTVQIADKLRALDPPVLLPTQAGHGLANDYWAEVLSPPFFQKMKFGNRKEVVTPAAVSLEWSIPSPPDYHHFNEVPRMTAELPAESKESQVAPAH
ncbi:hypothetical protein HK405_014768 [Cladochytrium tenue]|nr:hypothetical protein HK405_014768 [Cladochytrium tenue]